jgi:hypothetical protein
VYLRRGLPSRWYSSFFNRIGDFVIHSGFDFVVGDKRQRRR